jgi:hypothetical protein
VSLYNYFNIRLFQFTIPWYSIHLPIHIIHMPFIKINIPIYRMISSCRYIYISLSLWLVVWTPLKNSSQWGEFFPIYGKSIQIPWFQTTQPVCIYIYASPPQSQCLNGCDWDRW